MLVNVFRTSPGDPARRQPTEVGVDVSAWAGQTVRLRLASIDNQGPLRAGVDNIRFQRTASNADGRVQLLATPRPSSAIDLALNRMAQADAVAALPRGSRCYARRYGRRGPTPTRSAGLARFGGSCWTAC